jgi:hypothetical protein
MELVKCVLHIKRELTLEQALEMQLKGTDVLIVCVILSLQDNIVKPMVNVIHALNSKFQLTMEKDAKDLIVLKLLMQMVHVDFVKIIIITTPQKRNASQEYVIIDQE